MHGRPRPMKKALIVLAFLFSVGTPVIAQTPFYQGKTISIIVGTKTGDVYDLYPRLVAQFWSKYIPGNPNIIIQNVPGAASLIAANQVYNIAKPDGLTLGAINRAKTSIWPSSAASCSAAPSRSLLTSRANRLFPGASATLPTC